MTHLSGINLAVGWGTAGNSATPDLGAHGRTVDITETAPAPDSIDRTHKADTSKQILEGLAGAPETNVAMTFLADDTWTLACTMPINTLGSLYIWPWGRTQGYPQVTVGPARLHERTLKTPYENVIEGTLAFNSKAVATWTTYSSVAT